MKDKKWVEDKKMGERAKVTAKTPEPKGENSLSDNKRVRLWHELCMPLNRISSCKKHRDRKQPVNIVLHGIRVRVAKNFEGKSVRLVWMEVP